MTSKTSIPYRYLTLWHEERILNDTMPELLPGEAAFRSYYLPSLEGGTHTVKVKQTVTNPMARADDPEDNKSRASEMEQKFTVIAPRYKLVDDIVDSVFPPPGHSALPKILPHIVVKDPHFPWVRNPKPITVMTEGQDYYGGIPWVALITFTPDELLITDPTIFAGLGKAVAPNENLGVDILAEDIAKINRASATVISATPRPREVKEKASVITIKKSLFQKLFTEDGKVEISQYKYLSHVRKVATDGMMAAMHGQSGTYSMVVSHRLGPLDTKVATPLIAHLVSLEKVKDQNLDTMKDNVVMTSLYSWTYSSLPPDSFDVARAMRYLGDKLTVLKTDERAPVPPGSDTDPIDAMINKRQQDGYTLVRHRTKTGEETAALYRGPLTPTFVEHRKNGNNTIQSNFGTDLQILDAETSLMDITYAAAWQLGKTLAMGDTAFTAALSRVRRHMHLEALKESQKNVHCKLNAYMSREDVVASIKDLVNGLENLNTKLHSDKTNAVTTNRWQKAEVEKVDIALKSPHIYSQIYANTVPVALEMASSPDGKPFNYHNVPNNTDYAQVQSWVHDKLYLAGIPAHYLIPDKSYLPEETLRFFHMDENWTDAMVDGALSLANAWTNKPEEDYCRSALKHAIGTYLNTGQHVLGYRPQMPKYGFLLRSQMLVQFPDLTVTAEFNRPPTAQEEKPKAPILIHRKLASDIMLCLFDCAPPEFKSVKFTLPAHQQQFSIAETISTTSMRLSFKAMYALEKDQNPTPDAPKRGQPIRQVDYAPGTKIFDWDSRSMNIRKFAQEVYDNVKGLMKDNFVEREPTSAMLALQLNEPIYTLDIGAIAIPTALRAHNDIFQFLVPEFPAHKYPAPPLPQPLRREKHALKALDRPVPAPPILGPPVPEPDVKTAFARPVFNFSVRTFDNPGYIPSKRKLPQDLIFAITMGEIRRSYGYRITKLKVCIAVGEKWPGAKGWVPLLKRDYDPPYPVMLSNLRFNLFKKFDKDKLIIELVPRSSDGILLQQVAEASFMLSLARIVEWDQEQVCKIDLFVEYKGFENNPDVWNDYIEVKVKPDPPNAVQAEAEGWEYLSDDDF